MNNIRLSALEASLRRRIGRRLRIARWAKLLLIPTVAGAVYLGRHNKWFAYCGLALAVLEILALMMGEAQRCPLCDSSLAIRKKAGEEFVNACPDCGFLID